MTISSMHSGAKMDEIRLRIQSWEKELAETSQRLQRHNRQTWQKHADEIQFVTKRLSEAAKNMPYSGQDDITALKELAQSLGASVEDLLLKLKPG